MTSNDREDRQRPPVLTEVVDLDDERGDDERGLEPSLGASVGGNSPVLTAVADGAETPAARPASASDPPAHAAADGPASAVSDDAALLARIEARALEHAEQFLQRHYPSLESRLFDELRQSLRAELPGLIEHALRERRNERAADTDADSPTR